MYLVYIRPTKFLNLLCVSLYLTNLCGSHTCVITDFKLNDHAFIKFLFVQKDSLRLYIKKRVAKSVYLT